MLERVTTLGTEDGRVPISRYSFVVQDARGRFYAASPWDAFPISVYSVDGRFLRSIGRKGPGPGEFSSVSAMYDIRDEAKITDTIIEVIDPRAARVVARTRFPEALNWFFGQGLVSEVNQNDADDAEIRVHRLRLVRP